MDREGVIKFIQDKLAGGVRDEQILGEFIGQGWNFRDVSQLLDEAKKRMAPASSQSPQVSPGVPVAANIQQASFPMTNGPATGSKKKKTGLMVGIVALVLALCAGGAYAYYAIYVNPNPDGVLHKMMSNVSAVKAFSISLAGDRELSSPSSTLPSGTLTQPAKGSVHAEISGDVDFNDPGNLQLALKFQAQGGVGFSMLSLGGQLIYKDKTVYLNVNPGTSIGPISLNMIAGPWIKIEPQKDLASSTMPGINLNLKNENLSVTPEQIARERELIAGSYFFKNIVNLSNENVDGITTHHYKFDLDKAALDKFGADSARIFSSSYDAATMQPDLGAPGSTQWEIWVGAGDYLPRKIVQTDIQNQKRITVTMKNFDNIPQIQAPQDTKSFEEVMGLIFGDMFGEMNGPSATGTPPAAR